MDMEEETVVTGPKHSDDNRYYPIVRLKDSEKDRCTNCSKLYDPLNGILRQTFLQWYDQADCSNKNIKIVEAAVLVFEGLLNMNENRISPLDDLSMCSECVYNMAELYGNYRQFMERSVSTSYFRRVFPKCMLWRPGTKRKIYNTDYKRKPVAKSRDKEVKVKQTDNDNDHELRELIPTPIVTRNSCKIEYDAPEALDTELDIATVELKEEPMEEFEDANIYEDSFPAENDEYNDDDDDYILSEDEDFDSNEGTDKAPKINFTRKRRIESDVVSKIPPGEKIGDINPVQLANGKWFLPKIAKVKLKRYIEGERKTLDVGKNKYMFGQPILLETGERIVIPGNWKTKKQRTEGEKQCSICLDVFTNNILYREHKALHRERKERKFKAVCCLHCGKTLSNLPKLRNHVRCVHTTEKNHVCTYEGCEKRFSLAERLRQHVKLYHESTLEDRRERERRKRQRTPRKKSKHVPFKDLYPDRVDEVTCEICKKVFSTILAKQEHVLVIHKNEKPFPCKFCQKRFVREALLIVHEEIHLGLREPRKYQCTSCEKTFSYQRALREHIATHHSNNPKAFVCELCGTGFSVLMRLNKHKTRVHETIAKNHQCDICGNKFKTKQILTAHKKLHTDERPHLCPTCGQDFKVAKHLNKHLVTQHCVGAAAKCDLCQKGFMKISDYEEHMQKGYHIKPKFLRPMTRKRNYNAPSYVKARLERKLERQKKRRERELANYRGDRDIEAELEEPVNELKEETEEDNDQNRSIESENDDNNIEADVNSNSSSSNSNTSVKEYIDNTNLSFVPHEESEQVITQHNVDNIINYEQLQMMPTQQVQYVQFTGISQPILYTFHQNQ